MHPLKRMSLKGIFSEYNIVSIFLQFQLIKPQCVIRSLVNSSFCFKFKHVGWDSTRFNLLNIWAQCGSYKNHSWLSFHLYVWLPSVPPSVCLPVRQSVSKPFSKFAHYFFQMFCIKSEDDKYKSWQHWIFLEKGKWPKMPQKYILKFFEEILSWFYLKQLIVAYYFPEQVHCLLKLLFWIVLKVCQSIWLKNPLNISVLWTATCVSVIVNIQLDNRKRKKFRIPYWIDLVKSRMVVFNSHSS